MGPERESDYEDRVTTQLMVSCFGYPCHGELGSINLSVFISPYAFIKRLKVYGYTTPIN